MRRRLNEATPQIIPATDEKKVVELITRERSVEAVCFTPDYQLINRAGHVLTPSQAKYTTPEKVLLSLILAYK